MAVAEQEEGVVLDDSTLLATEGEEGEVDDARTADDTMQWTKEESARAAVGEYAVWSQRSGHGTQVMKLSAEKSEVDEEEGGRFYFTAVLDKDTLIKDCGFHPRMPFDGMAQMIDDAIRGDDEQLTVSVELQKEGRVLLLKIIHTSKYHSGGIEHAIELARAEVTQVMLLQRKVSLLEHQVTDLLQEQAKDKGTIVELRSRILKLEARLLAARGGGGSGGSGEDDEKKEEDAGDDDGRSVPSPSNLVPDGVMKGHSRLVYSVDISSDGRIAVSGAADGTIRVWNVREGKSFCVGQHAPLASTTGTTASALLTRYCRYVISCGYDGMVKLWLLRRPKFELVWEAIVYEKLWAFCLNDDESMIAVASCRDKHCYLLNREDGTLAGKISTQLSGLFAVRFAGSLVLCAGGGKKVHVIDVAKQRVVRHLVGPSSHIVSIAHSPVSDMVAASSNDKSIHVWHLGTGAPVAQFKGLPAEATSILFHPVFPDVLIACSSNHSISMWSISASACVYCLDSAHSDAINDICVSSDGTLLLSAADDMLIRKWSIGSN